MSGSKRQADRWPERERRERQRRSGQERRVVPKAAGEERRTHQRRSGQERRNETGWQPVSIEPAVGDGFDPAGGLIAAATEARTHAHARYSDFQVGAALETTEGRIVGGCNIENATYGLTLCAERVALVKALSDGHEVFTRIAVVADTADLTPPCGPCRQLLWEYCGDIEVILANLDGASARYRLSALLPLPFDSRLLK